MRVLQTRSLTAGLVAAVGIAITGCTADVREDPEAPGGNDAPDAMVDEDVGVLDVMLAHPEDDVYEPGDDAQLYVDITNSGQDPVILVDVTGDDFADADIDGGAVEVGAESNVHVGSSDAPTIVLQDLGVDLRTSQTIDVTFEFEGAGEVTVPAMVAAEGTNPVSQG